MKMLQIRLPAIMAAAAGLALMMTATLTSAATAEDLNEDSLQALDTLYQTEPVASTLAESAKAVLVFPNIVKAGFVFGGGYGEGVMFKGTEAVEYYNSVTGSWGFQIGAQSYAYAIFLMTDEVVSYIEESNGWELGVGPTIVVVDTGVAKNLSTSSLQDDAYAFIFSQQGLMAGISIEGSKISRIDRLVSSN